MPVIGVTGGIATGKSTFCDCLREVARVTFFDADKAARALTDQDMELRSEIAMHFGADIYSPSGDLNRPRLRAIVFSDPEKKRALEQILHPRIRRQWSIEAENRRTSADLFVADIPLLYETGGETLCDAVVVVACSAAIQRQRLVERTLLEPAAAQRMIDSQMPLPAKISRADHVVWNNGSRAAVAAQAELLAKLWEQR